MSDFFFPSDSCSAYKILSENIHFTFASNPKIWGVGPKLGHIFANCEFERG